jgi:hypothetical protein
MPALSQSLRGAINPASWRGIPNLHRQRGRFLAKVDGTDQRRSLSLKRDERPRRGDASPWWWPSRRRRSVVVFHRSRRACFRRCERCTIAGQAFKPMGTSIPEDPFAGPQFEPHCGNCCVDSRNRSRRQNKTSDGEYAGAVRRNDHDDFMPHIVDAHSDRVQQTPETFRNKIALGLRLSAR